MTPAWLGFFGFSDAPFSKEIGDADLWLPSSKAALVDELCEALGQRASVDRAVGQEYRVPPPRPEGPADPLVPVRRLHRGVGVEDQAPLVGKELGDGRLARADPPGQSDNGFPGEHVFRKG